MTKPRVGVVFRPQSPPEELRAAVLAWSERIAVGIGLLPVPLRNPALAAMEIATLARTFPGRFVPALGHGVLSWMGQVGARVESPMTLLREYTVAVRSLLHGETVTVDGRYVHLDEVALEWPPAVVPPLIVGGRGPKTVRLAGEVGDGVLLDASANGPDVAWVERSAALVTEGAAGRPAPAVVAFVEVDGASAARIGELVEEHAAAGATSVVLQGTGTDPDPVPLIAGLATR